MTNTQKKNLLRERELNRLMETYTALGYEPMRTAGGTLYVFIDGLEPGEKVWLKVSTILPNASEEEATDGYALAEEYQMKEQEKADKLAEKEKEKAKKIAKDKARRAEKKAK